MKLWKDSYKSPLFENVQITNDFDEVFPDEIPVRKSKEETKHYLLNLRIERLNDLNYPNIDCKCDERCDFKGVGDILQKTSHEVELMGYNPNLKIGNCWKYHCCTPGMCDGCFLSPTENIFKCKYTGRKYDIYTDYEYVKIQNEKGKMYELLKKNNTMELLHSKRNVDVNLNKISRGLTHLNTGKIFKKKKFRMKRERKVKTSKIGLNFTPEEIFDLIKKLRFEKSFTEFENEGEDIPFFIFSRNLYSFLTEITDEQLLISLGVLNVHSILDKKKISKSELDIIKIFEDKMLKLLPGFFRLTKEIKNMINVQNKQYAVVKKYLTDYGILKMNTVNYLDIYDLLYFDDKWFGDNLTRFPTWKEWLEILYMSVNIWELCKLCGNDKAVNSISIIPEDIIVSILNVMAEGWKYGDTYVVQMNMLLSEQFNYLRLNSFSSYGINPKIHKNGMKILKSSLNYICKEVGVKVIIDYLES